MKGFALTKEISIDSRIDIPIVAMRKKNQSMAYLGGMVWHFIVQRAYSGLAKILDTAKNHCICLVAVSAFPSKFDAEGRGKGVVVAWS